MPDYSTAEANRDKRNIYPAALWAAGLAGVLPLLVFWHSFRQLFYFSDDWNLLEEASRLSLFDWSSRPFLGESIIPVFKLLWLGALHFAGGSYFGMICLLWITHLGICLLFGHFLQVAGLPLSAIIFAVLTFGLSWSNIETLGWSMQWSAQLALLFFLAAWLLLFKILNDGHGIIWYSISLWASALSSSRGISSGLLLGLFALLLAKEMKQKIILCSVSFLPSLVAAAFTLISRSNQSIGHDMLAALSYAAYYFLLNPLYNLLPYHGRTMGVMALFVYGIPKLIAIAWALVKAKSPLRLILSALVACDLVNAAALGFGRYQTGIDTAVSWRYQYLSLLCFGPLLGLLVARQKRMAQLAALLIWVPVLGYPWKRHAPRWAGWRGSQVRQQLISAPSDARLDASSVTVKRALELKNTYNLH
jgi:hypothetical protein